jgi:hypothetical protein
MARYIFTNVGRGNIFRQRKAFSVAKSLGKNFGRRGWVEIGESDGKIKEAALLKLTYPKKKWDNVYIGTHTPITAPKGQITHARRIFGANGRPGGWPKKWWVRASFHKDHVIMYNGHLPPGAFNNKHHEKYEEARKSEWNRMWKALTNAVRIDHDEVGYHVIVMCDANRQGDQPKPHKDAILVAHHKTDYIWAVPAPGYRVLKGSSGSKLLGIDFHRVLWVDVKFGKK